MGKEQPDTKEVQTKRRDDDWTTLSLFLQVFLPVAGLALLWGQRGIFSRLLLQLDRSCVSVFCPSLSKREKLLKWASGRLPSTWSSPARTLASGIPELWKDGSLLCTLINSVVPGACPNPHRHWRKPPVHAQALAYKYLGIPPIFSETQLAGDLTMDQERSFIHYLQQLQQAISKWASKDEAHRAKFSSQYVARGMGLYTGEQHRKTVFYVYSNAATKKRSDLLMYIRGPYGTQGKTTIPPAHGIRTLPVASVLQDQLKAAKISPFKSDQQHSFLKTISMDFTSLITGVEDKNPHDDIPIEIEMEVDRVKVSYIPNNAGMYEINLICDGELVKGSPYHVRVINNASHQKDTFNTTCENVEKKITFAKRKVLSKVIDCIDEKICIDNDAVSKIPVDNGVLKQHENNDVTITAVTKKKDEILKTEINCTLEDIVEEGDKDKVPTHVEDEGIEMQSTLNKFHIIAEELPLEATEITDFNIDSLHKVVSDVDEAKTEILDLFNQDTTDHVDNILEPQPIATSPVQKLISKLDFNLIDAIQSSAGPEVIQKILPAEFMKKSPASTEDDHLVRPQKRITSKMYLEIAPTSKPRAFSSLPNSQEANTSPICPDHIAPEVDKSSFNSLPLSERRKIFSRQSIASLDSENSSFSVSENGDESKSKNSSFRELSVLNVLDTLRQSRKGSLSEPYSLSSAASLPNMASLESVPENNFKSRRDYWERMSSRSSSNVSLVTSDYSQSRQRSVSNKNLFNKFSSIEKESHYDLDKTDNVIVKSTSDILSNHFDSINSHRKYKSMDESLDECSMLSIEERKKILMESYNEIAKPPPKKLNIKVNFTTDDVESKSTTNDGRIFAPISERIRKFDDSMQVKPKITNLLPMKLEESAAKPEPKKTSPKQMVKSQFKRAVRFFKNLEDNSKFTKPKNTNNQKVVNNNRRYSLDYQSKNNNAVKKGGSLNLPNISERFSINNLYDDVFGMRKGSFKGTPNMNAVVDSLTSFGHKPEPNGVNITQQDENISFNLFVNKAKTKKRRSIKTLFDVNY